MYMVKRKKSEHPTGTALHLGQTVLSIKSSSTPDNYIIFTVQRRGEREREPQMAADCWGLYDHIMHVKRPSVKQMTIASMAALALRLHLMRTVYACRIELSCTNFLWTVGLGILWGVSAGTWCFPVRVRLYKHSSFPDCFIIDQNVTLTNDEMVESFPPHWE